jgi:hypothetical protein
MNLSFAARAFVTLVIVLGLCVFGNAIVNASEIHAARLAVFLLVACLAARLKVKLPGLTGSMSVNLPFILIAVAGTGMLEALIVACVSNLVQCLPRNQQKFNLLRAIFNVCNMALAVEATRLVYNWPAMAVWVASPSLRLGVAAAAFFLVNTLPVAIVIVLTEGEKHNAVFRTWLGISQLTFPYFVASAGVAAAVLTAASYAGWLVPTLVLPVMLGFYYSYRRIFSASSCWADLSRKGMQSEAVGEKQSGALA